MTRQAAMSSITNHITTETEPFWAGLKRGQVLLQSCSQCHYVRHPISWICPQCLSEEFTWQAMSGHGTVETFIWYMQRIDAVTGGDLIFDPEFPYNVAVIGLTEGPRLVSNVRDVSFGDLRVGQKVSASFDTVPGSDWAVLRFVREA
jgi:uncharacterized OB-fold protein